MLTHPAPESVFYLGMGTGITAGASLSFDVEQVVVCEILPEVVALADRHFRPWVGGLFTTSA
jgi:spermidine synthase